MSDPDIVDPEVAIIDAHHHQWDPAGAVTQGQFGRYMVEELAADVNSGHNVKATVFVECGSYYNVDGPAEMAPVGEVAFARGVAAVSGGYGPTHFCNSIVGYADLLGLGADVDPVLEALIAQGNGRLKGIRYRTNNDPDVGKAEAPPHTLANPVFKAGYARLAKYGLSFDCWAYHPQLGELIDLVREHPGVPVAMNHCGGLIGLGTYAGRREEAYRQWRGYIGQLSRYPNVYMKLGGFFMPVFGLGMEGCSDLDAKVLAKAARPIIETCIELFGPERCMFESNFPVTREFISYRTMWNCYKLAIADLSPSEKRTVLHDTAESFYHISY